MATHGDRYGWIRYGTLTAPGKGHMPLEEVKHGMNAVMTNLRKRRPDGTRRVEEYACVVEFQKRLEPHVHFLFAGREDGFIPKAELSRLAVGPRRDRGKFGPIVDITQVNLEDTTALEGYLTKFEELGANLAGYMAKGKAKGWYQDDRTRIRPYRASRGWYPGGQAAAEEAVRKRWYGGDSLPAADDWRLERVNPETGALEDLGPLKGGGVHILRPRLRRAA